MQAIEAFMPSLVPRKLVERKSGIEMLAGILIELSVTPVWRLIAIIF